MHNRVAVSSIDWLGLLGFMGDTRAQQSLYDWPTQHERGVATHGVAIVCPANEYPEPPSVPARVERLFAQSELPRNPLCEPAVLEVDRVAIGIADGLGQPRPSGCVLRGREVRPEQGQVLVVNPLRQDLLECAALLTRQG